MTIICSYCSSHLGNAVAPFCQPCRQSALDELTKATANKANTKVSCYACKKLFVNKTIASHAGFCGRCSAVSAMSTDMSHTTINNQLARVVWQHYFVDGRIEQLCYCCNEQRINVWSYQCGHVIAAAKNGPTTVDNLRPICSACNQGMGTQDMREFSKVNGFQGLLSAERGLSAPYPPTQVASNQAPNQASNRQRYDSVVVHMGAERPHNPLYTSTNDQDHMEADDQDHVGVDDQDNKKHKLRDRCVIS